GVVKVEQLPDGDPLRGDVDGNLDFVYCNLGKRSVMLDLDSATGRNGLDALIDRADVVIETCDTQTRERLGLEPEKLREGRDSLVVVSVTPFGSRGPYRDWRASEHVIYSM